MKKQLYSLGATALLLGGAMEAHAISMSYEISGGSVLANTETDDGLNILTQISDDLPGYSFSLDDGESETFPFFKIWTDEGTVNLREDTVPKSISATLNFSDPTGLSADVPGVTFGANLFIFQTGIVLWGGPSIVTAGDRTFSLELDDAIFNSGLFGMKPGEEKGGWINATITQTSSRTLTGTPPTNVPEAASTLVLLGAGVAALIGFKRKVL